MIRRRRFMELLSGTCLGLELVTTNSSATFAAPPPDISGVHISENIWIPMPDGRRLAARLFLPPGQQAAPTGVVIEYLPYRKRDAYRYRDDIAGPGLANRGIGLIRIDIRGTGDSEGVIDDEYNPPEQDDLHHVIDWLVAQPWCNGHVGMRGISYGSFNGLQAAEKGYPALKAIVSACGTEQRYLDDIHYRGGCMVQSQLDWGMEWQVIMRAAPDPEIVGGDRWRALWQERLDVVAPVGLSWMEHQRKDRKWTYGSIQDYSAIRCAIFHVGGMLDSYVNSGPRLMELAPHVPQKALIGPWTHKWPGYPDPPGHTGAPAFVANGIPDPGIDWLPVEARWWRHWLMGEENGIMDGPALWAFREDAPPGLSFPQDTPGQWASSQTWPPRHRRTRVFHFSSDGLKRKPHHGRPLVLRTNLTTGFSTPTTYITGDPDSWWRDQSRDDAQSLVLDTPPLDTALDLMGQPVFRIRVSSSEPIAKLFVRLNEVMPDGSSRPVSNAILNLTHRDSDSAPSPLVPGQEYDVCLKGLFACYRFAPGSRLRVALSESWWPVTWPSPRMVTLRIMPRHSSVELPLAPDRETPPLPFTVLAGRYDHHGLQPAPYHDSLHDVRISGPEGQRTFTLEYGSRQPQAKPVPGLTTLMGDATYARRVIREDDPGSAVMESECSSIYVHKGQKVMLRANIVVSCDSTSFHGTESFEAWLNGKRIMQRQWTRSCPRDLA